MRLIETTVEQIGPQDQEYRARAKKRLDQLTMPHWALGRLMDLAMDLAGMTRSLTPPVGRKVIVTMAGDHGVVQEGVSKYPREVTPQMVHNFVNGGAGINALARQAGARVVVSYASANRDERHFPDPDQFDIERNPLDHLAFGLGNHTCAGQGLARLEGLAVFSALAQNIDGFAMAGPAQRDPNSITRGFSHLPMRIQ